MLIELEPCPPGEPGFLLYRGTGKHAESSSLQRGLDLSYAMSLFGGWFFDGPSNGTASACTAQYLLTANGLNRNYWIVKIKWSGFLTPGRHAPLLHYLVTPAIPVSVQLFGCGPGFHARLSPRPELSAQIYVIQNFIASRGLHYNLQIYTFTNQLEVLDLGQTSDPELPIAQWQNYEGGHFDPLLRLLG